MKLKRVGIDQEGVAQNLKETTFRGKKFQIVYLCNPSRPKTGNKWRGRSEGNRTRNPGLRSEYLLFRAKIKAGERLPVSRGNHVI